MTITFKDKNLYKRILKEVGEKIQSKNDDTCSIVITKENLNSIKTLDINGYGDYNPSIVELSGLEKFSGLTNLDLSSNLHISDISALKDMTNLKQLNLNSVVIGDIGALKNLKNIEILNLERNNISDISALKDMTSLKKLILYENKISDIGALKNMTSLDYLELDYNQIGDISVLKNLTNLSYLSLNGNKISDISVLKDMTSLESLNLRYNQISDISALKNITYLNHIDLSYNQIGDISALKDMTKLDDLYLKGNQISDLSFLTEFKDITFLENLDLSDNQISDLSALKNIKIVTFLKNLNLGGNQISDINALKDTKDTLVYLRKLDLGGNKISDISALKDMTRLTDLCLCDNQISDISALKDLTNLSYLNLGGNQISDISALKDITSLKYIHLHDNQISDVSALKELTYSYIGLDSQHIYGETLLPSGYEKPLEVNLPNIFIETRNQNSCVYSNKTFKCENCSINGDNVSIDANVKNAKVTIDGGKAIKSTFEIKVKPAKTIKFNDANLYNSIKNQLKYRLPENDYIVDDANKQVFIAENKIDIIIALTINGKNIEDITGLEQFTGLQILDLDDNNIKNIEKLNSLSSLNTLHVNNNNLNDFTKIAQITNLKTLYANDNNFENLNSIENLSKLENLQLKNNNISNIGNLSRLEKLNNINLDNNRVSDLSSLSGKTYNAIYFDKNNIEKIGNIKFTNGSFSNNKINKTIVNTTETELPEIFRAAKDSSNILYSDKDLYCEGCTVEGNRIIVDNTATSAKVVIQSGYAAGTTFNITVNDEERLEYEVSYGDVMTKIVDGVELNYRMVTLTTNKPIKAMGEWTKLDNDDKYYGTKFERAYTYNVENQKISIVDKSGKSATVTINVSGVRSDIIPGIEVRYTDLQGNDVSGNVNHSVVITVSADVDLANVDGWEYVTSSNKKVVRKTYEDETEITFDIITPLKEDGTPETDPAKKRRLDIQFFKIDKTPPKVTVNVEPQGNIIAKSKFVEITADEDIDRIEPVLQFTYNNATGENYNYSEDEIGEDISWSYKKNSDGNIDFYSRVNENKHQYYKVYDRSGNFVYIKVFVEGIDNSISIDSQYDNLSLTNQSVILNIQSKDSETIQEKVQRTSENIQRLMTGQAVKVANAGGLDGSVIKLAETTGNSSSGSSSSSTITKTYTENTKETLIIDDEEGNEDFIPVDIQNIDKVAPVVSKPTYTTNSDGTVTVRVAANKELQEIEGWNGWNLGSDKKTLIKTFSSNSKELLKVKDLAGNTVEVQINVDSINPGLEVLDVKIEKVELDESEASEDLDDDIDVNAINKYRQVGEYKVTITFSNEVKDVYGWESSFDGTSIWKLFSRNDKETIEIEDYYGNKKSIVIDIEKLLNGEDPEIIDIDNKDNNEGKTDGTQSDKPIPGAGKFIIPFMIVAGVIFVINRRKLKRMRHIK